MAQPNDGISEEIRTELVKYDKHYQSHCIPCGYEGYFGCVKKYWPWYYKWWFILLTTPLGIGVYLAMGRGLVTGFGGGFWLIECPSCKRQYETK